MQTHLKALLSALIFSTLLYSKSFGLNLLLVAVLVIALLITVRKERPLAWAYLLAYFFTGSMVFVAPTTLNIGVHFITLVVLVGKSIALDTSIYLSGFIGLLNLITASIAHLVEGLHTGPKAQKSSTLNAKAVVYLKGAFIAGVLGFVFVLLYRKANPIFEELVSTVDFSFISFPWVLFTLIGYLLFLHLLRPFYPKELIDLDVNTGNTLAPPSSEFSSLLRKKLGNEHTLASIIFTVLNVLLVFFLVTDVLYLLAPNISSNAQYSQSVHQGVYALLFSIVCAIIVILYFFRGNLNFFTKNTQLKRLTYTWIGLNLILIGFTAYKNAVYIDALGFTYKRIGVFIYLLLTLVGLITTYYKVAQVKNLLFLVRTNLASVFVFFVLSTAVPWDQMITKYNLSQLNNPDISYLISLGKSNSDILYRYMHHNNSSMPPEERNAVIAKYTQFKQWQEAKTWQEYTLYQFVKH